MAMPEQKTRRLLRLNALAAGSLSLLSSLSYFCHSFPFPKALAVLAFVSSIFYFLYVLFFDLICRTCYLRAGMVLSQIGIIVVTFAVYYTGGIVSPFVFLYFAMLISEAIYGLDNPVTMPACITGYLIVTGGHFFGFLPNHMAWSEDIYRSPLAVFVIVGLTVSYLAITSGMSARIIENFKLKSSRDEAEKDALLRKFSELNSTTQLGVLAHRIAHDLRGPIASISGYLEMEAAKQRSKEEKEELCSVMETVDCMVETLHGITRFGKPGGPSVEKLNLPAFMRDIVAIASFAPRAKGVRFEVADPGGEGLTVTASRADLQQACFNIIKNAVEAVSDNPDAKHVRITFRREDKDVKVLISDNGPGIADETIRNVFRRSVTTKADGTGVGLMITRDLIVRNGGEIKLRNREDGGVTAEVSLPLA